MLWKPAAPVYPPLIKKVPDGLTLEEVMEMRKKGRKLIPICKLGISLFFFFFLAILSPCVKYISMLNILLFVHVAGKNGVYSNLVKHVREAFEECELVRINCQGMNGSDFRKIGAKLKVFFHFLHLMKKR